MSNESIEATCTLTPVRCCAISTNSGLRSSPWQSKSSLRCSRCLPVPHATSRRLLASRDPRVNGVANPCRFAGVVLEGIGEIVEVGRLVEHVQKSDRRGEGIASLLHPPGRGGSRPVGLPRDGDQPAAARPSGGAPRPESNPVHGLSQGPADIRPQGATGEWSLIPGALVS